MNYLFPLNNIGKTHPTTFIWGNACLPLVCNLPFPSTSLEFQNPHGQVSYYGGRQTGRSVWESCWKNDPPPTRMPFKINKQRKENERTSLCHRESKCRITIWRNTLGSRLWGTNSHTMRLFVCFAVTWFRWGSDMRYGGEGLDGKLRSWCEQEL